MVYTSEYQSPLGSITLAADENGIIGLWIYGQKHFGEKMPKEIAKKETPDIAAAKRWLDIYFGGNNPDFMPSLNPIGSEFQLKVWDILLKIPYGTTLTYGEISKTLAKERGGKMSAQAVGGAVGRNPISIIIPCHRVVGADGNLTGYAGGIDKKVGLLTLEGVNMKNFFVGKRE